MKARISRAFYLLSCIILCLAGRAHCSEYEYKAYANRDPFIPLITGEVRLSLGLEYVESIEDIRLEGIIYDPNAESLAILNGEMMKEGDALFNVGLVKIFADGVKIKIYDETYMVSLSEEGGE
ncbi:MAG: hypothetical protein JW800_06575 [Candidatus Omnitrophica bacterium]|nr:hypothetical protein [Candidatus Omnitrophota bacterium]